MACRDTCSAYPGRVYEQSMDILEGFKVDIKGSSFMINPLASLGFKDTYKFKFDRCKKNRNSGKFRVYMGVIPYKFKVY